MQASVLVVEDDNALGGALRDTLEMAGFNAAVTESAESAIDHLRANDVDAVITDIQMPGMDGHELLLNIRRERSDLPVLLMTAFGSVENAVAAMRDGASDYLVKPFEPEVLVTKLGDVLPEAPQPDTFVAEDPATLELLQLARRVAVSDATVMLCGESGVGKEVMFRFLHQESPRHGGPAVAVNCAAIPENMLEAMLFGYEKGAYTGAYKATAGKFEQAQGGTLFLDEVSEMPLPLQAKLLRILQERQVERLGGSRVVDLDVRIVAATNRDLKDEVAAGRFREDLYYRMNVFPLRIPPLRERPRDILPLARHCLAAAAARSGMRPPTLTPAAEGALLRHAWPGNVRQLDNVMQRACILQAGDVIDLAEICLEDVPPAPLSAATAIEPEDKDSLEHDLRDRERQLILAALEEGGGSRKRAAEKLGISDRTLRYKIARLRENGIEVPR